MTFALGDPAHIQKGHNDLITAIQEQADLYMIEVTLPDTAHLSDTGHVDDHNLMVSALQAIADVATSWAIISATTGTPTIDTYTDGDGDTWTYYEFTSDGTVTIGTAGFIDALVVGGGSCGSGLGVDIEPSGGRTVSGSHHFDAGTHTVTIGASGTIGSDTTGKASTLGPLVTGQAGFVAASTVTSSITGTSIDYAKPGQASPRANKGDGGIHSTGPGSAGVVIFRVRTN